ncbi:MAG TPA: NAD(P)/FAD-dependent oxidoreductase [Gaiellaceae bacterium]|nr:NAD(P)/FAD-dependent oxidoreductase [Gaiellaceae bacterium]
MKVVVLGGGSTGEHFVGALRRLDAEVELTLVERRLVGGECSYWACMPTKTMLRAPEVVAAGRRSPGVLGGTLDVPAVFAWRDLVAERDDASQVAWLADQRCTLVRGDARIARPGVVEVEGEELPYDRLVVATGSSPLIPPVRGLESTDFWTNVEATETTEVPARLLVLGGGPVGCELSQFFARVGSRVVLVQGEARILPRIDAEAAALVEEGLREDGIELVTGATLESVEGGTALLADGKELPFDRILVATGRTPNLDGLGPLGLETSRRGIEVDERLRAAENVWAIGDVTGIAQFTHVGKYQARIAAYDIAGRQTRADYRAIPATIFTDPQVATVGTLDGGRLSTWQLTSTPRLSTYERPKRKGFLKVAADPDRRVLTGAVAVGPEAGEWLQQLTLAIRAETPIEILLDVIQPYPTFSEAVFLALRGLALDL